ncbi:MAG: DNA-binding response regulator [Gammaproteobacteria bacterium]|nr:MAG: DNA-binding response regulator [Gammaproteobacteria bacterium]
MRVLVVEDESVLREQLSSALIAAGFVVDQAIDGDEGLFYGHNYPCDAVVLDLGLPGKNGMELIAEWRSAGVNVPILILTARSAWQDKVAGLEAGADDYLVKPFVMQELIARLHTLIRRASGWSHNLIKCPPYELDRSAGTLAIEGVGIELTRYEYRLLEYLMLHAGEVLSKTSLTEHLYADEAQRDSNVIEVFVRRLRSKLDPDSTRLPIETVRGAGYRFVTPKQQ